LAIYELLNAFILVLIGPDLIKYAQCYRVEALRYDRLRLRCLIPGTQLLVGRLACSFIATILR
jgi:hypothetical protein